MSKSLFQRWRFLITVARISRLLLVLTLFLLLCWPQQNLVQAAGGDLDFTFGDRGLVNTDFNNGDELKALAIQPDGKIIAVGFGTGNFALARYNTDSAPDFSFGSGGKVNIRFLNTLTEPYAVALQPDGKIVVAGRIFNDATGNDFVVARYNPDGSFDSTFGSNGAAIADFGGLPEIATSVAIQPDGKIVVAGQSFARFALARFNPDGSLNTTFGSGGKVVTNFFGSGQSIHAIAIDSNRRIVVAGRVNNPNTLTSTDFAVARYRSDGSLDSSFGSGGLVTTDFFGREDFAFSMMIQPDERIVLAGYAENLFERKDFALARYNRNGSLNTTFGSEGKVSSDLFKNVDGRFSSTDLGFAAAIQFDGKIVVAGKTINEGIAFESRFALARYNSEGSLNTTFGSDGIIATTLSGLFQDAQVSVQTSVLRRESEVSVGRSNRLLTKVVDFNCECGSGKRES